MKKKIFLSVLIISLFLLVACEKEPQVVTSGAYIGGTSGIIASFEPFSIKDEETGIYTIYDNEDFSLEVTLKNKGEESVPIGEVELILKGPYQGDFNNIPRWTLKNEKEIEKISEFNPEGGEEIVSFTPNNNYAEYKNPVTGYIDLNWHLEYKYNYNTYLIINDVCFKGNPADPKVCQLNEDKTFSVSGAPITVTAVKEEAAGKGIVVLKIDVENKGLGDSTISGKEFDNRFNLISYTVDEPNKWECTSGGRENEARVVDNKAQIICKLKTPLAEDEVYERTVQLTLDYVYKELIQEKLRVKESIK